MPAYDYRCVTGHEWEMVHSVAECDVDHECPKCGRLGSRIIHAAALHGAIFDKKISIGGSGMTFNTNAELREYERNNPDVKHVSSSDSWWQSHKDEARENAERVAMKKGFRDLDHKRDLDNQAKAKGETPSPVFDG